MNQLHQRDAPVFQYGRSNQLLHHFIYAHHHFSGQSFLSSQECQMMKTRLRVLSKELCHGLLMTSL
uniref:Uncharacterized protein n=1 Tax=Arundo donax TaxID=35708 RepID=A0A0A9CV78_ARUDO